MKLYDILKLTACFLPLLAASGCQDVEQEVEARAVATSENLLTFEAQGAPAQTIKVYADGSWAADTPDAWIQVSPMTGRGPAEVTITVADNVTGGVVDGPRTGSILFQGGTVERRGSVTVKQKGDTYKGVRELTVKEVVALDDEDVAKIPGGQVAAVTKGGFILTEDGENLYVQGARDVKVGDKVSLNGAKTTFNKCPSFLVDELEVLSPGTVTYPEAPDITAQIASFTGGTIPYVTIRGSLVNGALKVGPASIVVVDPVDELKLADVELHKVALTGYAVGVNGITGYLVATGYVDEGEDETLIPYPLKWAIGKDLNYSSATFNVDHPRIDPIQGVGYLEYVPYDLEGTNSTGNYRLDVESGNPRVQGPRENDYWLFFGNGAILAGTEVQIAFEMRSSKWGQKFWLLEYLDGDEWHAAGTPQTSTEPGTEVLYTVATDVNNTNQPVMETIRFRRNNEHLQIRLRCTVNWRGGGGPMDARSTATSRLAITNPDDDTYRPSVIILKEGNGVEKDPVYADIQVDPELLTFNGTPGAPKTLTVKSDYDWTISTAYDWLHLDVEGGLAGEETTVTVTCDESELAELREGTIRIVSEDSEKVVHVVQSAAGQMLDPFISVSTGNVIEVDAEEGTSQVCVQYNTDYEVFVDADWLTLTQVGTRALVNWDEYVLTHTANESEAPRVGTIRFFNEAKKLEAVVTVTQAGKEVIFENNLIQWGFDASLMDSYKDSFEKDNNFKANVAGVGSLSWNDLPENVALDVSAKKSHVIGGTGQPYITGAWPGDYWEFTVPLKNVPAGNTVTFTALHRISGTGQKYWRMDWSIDGTTWTPVKPLETETETGKNAQYTHIAPTSDVEITESFRLPEAVADGTLKIRFTCVANWQGNGKGALAAPNGGTHRWSGTAETGPKITITEPKVTVYYADGFDWLQKYIDAWVAANPGDADLLDPVGSQLSTHAQPNIWNLEALSTTLGAELESLGYEDLNKSAKTLYLQKNYFKMGANKKQTGLKLPAIAFEGDKPVDVVLTFDWCAHMGGSGAVDNVTITVELEGAGSCEDSGAALSNPIATTQETGQMVWQHASVTLKGVTSATRIKIRPTNMGSTPNYQRWHLDNIRITGK